MTAWIRGLQQAQDALKQELLKLNGGNAVLVGIHEDAEPPKGADISMATLGAIQHYGNEKIPARRWLDVGVEQGVKEYLSIIEEGVSSGKSQGQILNEVGAEAAYQAQQYITDLKSPPNALSTIKRKALKKDRSSINGAVSAGASLSEIQAVAGTNPLIQTGAMRSSVTWKISNKMPEEGL